MFILLALPACSELAIPVRATLDDGQILSGTLGTPTLLLEGGLGTIEIPIYDIGEVVPVEGGDLSGSGGHVNVWLRNGSELKGRWAEPELEIGVEAGGVVVPVDLPTDELLRFQMLEGQVWPEGLVYRVKTSHGDDFLVDPVLTQIEIENELGRFAPFLSECVSVAPIPGSEGEWRVELISGTVLQGPLVHDAINFAMPMGPDEVEVGLDVLVSLERENWSDSHYYRDVLAPAESNAEPMSMGWDADDEEQGAGAADTADGVWFIRRSMDNYKQQTH